MLMRMFYEGIVETVTQLVNLNLDSVNLQEQYIIVNDNKKVLSDRLTEVIKQYLSMDYITVVKSASEYNVELVTLDNMFMKVSNLRKNSVLEYSATNVQKTISMYFDKISLLLDMKIDASSLYKSGFINYVYERCGQNKAILLGLFTGSASLKIGKSLEDYANEYGLKNTKNKDIRRNYLLYVMKSKFYSV